MVPLRAYASILNITTNRETRSSVMKNKYIYLIWFIALLPTMILRDYTPKNELRYLSIVDEALRNGNIFTFTNQGEIYADKPPLHFWMMMVGKLILGEHRMWYYSLLSFIPALIILIVMSKWTRREIGANKTTPQLILITTGLFTGATLIVRMDMLMNMFIVLSLYTFYQMYKGENSKLNSFLFPVFVFLALFSKGALGFLIPFVSTSLFLLYKKRLSRFKMYWGWKSLLIILTACIIWFSGVYFEGGSEYLKNLLVHQTVERGIDSFHHKDPLYYYTISVWYSLAPWSLLAIGFIIVGLYKKLINTVLEQYFAIIIISTFILLSLISSKIEIYSLPMIPFFIYVSVMLFKKFDMQNRWVKLSIVFPAIILILAFPTIVYLSSIEEIQYLTNPFIYAGAGVFTITGLLVIYILYKRRRTYRAITSLALGFLLAIFTVGWSMPQLNNQIGWKNLCEKAMGLSEEQHIANFWVYDISRAENMDVYFKKDIIKVHREEIVNQPFENRILLLKSKVIKTDPEIYAIIHGHEQYQIGRYTIVLSNGKDYVKPDLDIPLHKKM